MKKHEPAAGFSRYRETYDGPIITDRVRRELLETLDKIHDWRLKR